MVDHRFDIFSSKQEKVEKNLTKNHTVKILLVFIAILVIIFILKPGLEGYGIYRQVEKTNYSLEDYAVNVQDLKLELSTTKTDLELHSKLNNQLQEQISSTSAQLTSCQGEKAAIQATLDSSTQICDQRVSLLQQQATLAEQRLGEIETKKTEEVNSATTQCTETNNKLQTLQANYDLLLKNSARTICCKQKVDNPDIVAYSVLEQKVVCLEEGGTALEC